MFEWKHEVKCTRSTYTKCAGVHQITIKVCFLFSFCQLNNLFKKFTRKVEWKKLCIRPLRQSGGTFQLLRANENLQFSAFRRSVIVSFLFFTIIHLFWNRKISHRLAAQNIVIWWFSRFNWLIQFSFFLFGFCWVNTKCVAFDSRRFPHSCFIWISSVLFFSRCGTERVCCWKCHRKEKIDEKNDHACSSTYWILICKTSVRKRFILKTHSENITFARTYWPTEHAENQRWKLRLCCNDCWRLLFIHIA